jgi:hypothetical protein
MKLKDLIKSVEHLPNWEDTEIEILDINYDFPALILEHYIWPYCSNLQGSPYKLVIKTEQTGT